MDRHWKRHKKVWHPIVRYTICSYKKWEKSDIPWAKLAVKAIDEALDETAKQEYGDFKVQTIKEVYIDGTRTLDGMAIVIPAHRNTVNAWKNQFFELVAKKMGIIN